MQHTAVDRVGGGASVPVRRGDEDHVARIAPIAEDYLAPGNRDMDLLEVIELARATEPEFEVMQGRVLITTEPSYLAGWTSTPQVMSYQRRFMRAARHVNEAPEPSPLATELQETTV